MEKLTIDAKIENLPAVTQFVTDTLEEKNCSLKIIMQIELVIEEIFVNIANYAYKDKSGMATVCKSFDDNPSALNLIFMDSGTKYNPLEHEDPDINLSAEDREIGGLGIFLVKRNVDKITYEYIDGQNILSIKKLL